MTNQTQTASAPLDLLNAVTSLELRVTEWQEKQARLAAVFDRLKLDAILVRRNENIAWITAGQVEARVAIPSETGVASLLITREGRKYYLTPNNEADRLADEEFPGLGFEALTSPWYEGITVDTVRRIAGSKVGTDIAFENFENVDLAPLRAPLTTGEIARFRWLAQQTAEITEQTLLDLEPGVTENDMAGRISERLTSQGIFPSVLLTATDDRIRKYKHAVPRGNILEQFGMLNLCARKWGLAVSITRYVHFGAPPQELADKFIACAEINAKLLHASRKGATSAQLYRVAENAYKNEGYAGEEKLHHQGGPAAYLEREWLASPNGQQVITDPQILAWNPSIRGAKVEDTVLLENGSTEILTLTPSLPQIDTDLEGINYSATDILVR
ncbi:MAG TPA: M24 family metallopeptidase [Pseudacidobacterium sp.]|jgi:antitoxin VapB|nr:M24 family metallopeptidase [Pseudacidobacterium sp.]